MPTVTQKGQVTIPIEMRKFLNIDNGDQVVFEIKDEKVVVRKKKKKAQFNKYIGFLKDNDGQSVDEIISRLRSE